LSAWTFGVDLAEAWLIGKYNGSLQENKRNSIAGYIRPNPKMEL